MNIVMTRRKALGLSHLLHFPLELYPFPVFPTDKFPVGFSKSAKYSSAWEELQAQLQGNDRSPEEECWMSLIPSLQALG